MSDDDFGGVVSNGTSVCDLDSTEVGLWYVGVILSILASIMGNFGVNTQKYSLTLESERPVQRPYIKQPFWSLGLALVISGSIMDLHIFG